MKWDRQLIEYHSKGIETMFWVSCSLTYEFVLPMFVLIVSLYSSIKSNLSLTLFSHSTLLSMVSSAVLNIFVSISYSFFSG